CIQAGVEIRLYTRVAAAFRDEDDCISYIVTESKSGREAWLAKGYVDATGDGDLAAHAGCGYDLGNPETGAMQPMSLIALVSGLKPEDMLPYTRIEKQSRLNLLADIRRGGFEPSYHSPGLWHIRDNL